MKIASAILVSFILIYLPAFVSASSDSMKFTTVAVMELDPEHIRTDINESNIDSLYRRFEQHFGDFIGNNPKRQLDYDFIMGKTSSLKTFDLLEWHQRAMEEGLDVKRFNKFGIIVVVAIAPLSN